MQQISIYIIEYKDRCLHAMKTSEIVRWMNDEIENESVTLSLMRTSKKMSKGYFFAGMPEEARRYLEIFENENISEKFLPEWEAEDYRNLKIFLDDKFPYRNFIWGEQKR